MRFGIFMAPFHPPAGQDPIYALQRDIEIVELLDRLDFDEAWIGEHHSAGTEIIPDPMIFISHVAATTRHIKLGTGVLSLPYHNPLLTADRAIFCDQLLRGRFMLGLGPGALPGDAAMLGISIEDQRTALEEDTDVLMALLRGETVTHSNSRYNLVEARSQYRPYSDFDIAVAAIASPTGPRIAGRHGIGLLSIGATAAGGFDLLGHHWNVLEERAGEFGQQVDRSSWRLVGPMHIAETKEQAIEDVKYGLDDWAHYTQKILAVPHFRAAGETFEERVEWVNESGLGVIGTPDDAIRQIERLEKQSNGGFGAYLLMHHEWANHHATRRHYELFAQYVKPRFQGMAAGPIEAEKRAIGEWESLGDRVERAVAAATEAHFGKQG
ncbi:MAG: LLM class flavin-dependent oxidoreductase [Actinomycetota bacterium]|nr:LLM class flavin-dependent oxidoreductase [Actinomycetota bacterium]MDA2973544.1 LLM class flavin-dependent oxidoreductase [Actinomycetota bacterium]MDA3009097.1 LLM class flavin-dependent oxidoreductase [Actinomycetota bacterium]